MKTIDLSYPLISIIIPVYNGSAYIGEAISSALSQTYPNVEVLVVNDGSNDNGATEQAIKPFSSKVRYFQKENGGVSTALNLGIQEMKGDFFSWLSHDDLYYLDKLQKQYEHFRQKGSPETIVYSHADFIDDKGNLLGKGVPFLHTYSLIYTLLYSRFIGGCNLLIPRAAFDEVGVFREDLRTIQDYELWFRFLLKGYTFEYLPITSGATRLHENQTGVRIAEHHIVEQDRFFLELLTNHEEDLQIDRGQSLYMGFLCLYHQYLAQGFQSSSKYCREKLRLGHLLDSPKDIVKATILWLKILKIKLKSLL